MRYQVTKSSVTISGELVRKSGGLVVLPLKEYQELRERAVPTYHLYGKEAEELDKLVTEGLRDHRAGRTISAPSLREALNKYDLGKRNKKD